MSCPDLKIEYVTNVVCFWVKTNFFEHFSKILKAINIAHLKSINIYIYIYNNHINWILVETILRTHKYNRNRHTTYSKLNFSWILILNFLTNSIISKMNFHNSPYTRETVQVSCKILMAISLLFFAQFLVQSKVKNSTPYCFFLRDPPT